MFGNGRRLNRMVRRVRDGINRQYAIAAGYYPKGFHSMKGLDILPSGLSSAGLVRYADDRSAPPILSEYRRHSTMRTLMVL